jgi:hypothetical protein
MTIVSKDSVICANESTSLTATGGNNYLWSHNSSTVSNVIITPGITTTYTVNTNDANGCTYSAVFTETVFSCAGLTTQSALDEELIIFPNPVTTSFKIRSTTENIHEVILRNDLGQIIYCRKGADIDHEVRQLAPGVYFCTVTSDGGTIRTRKIIVKE